MRSHMHHHHVWSSSSVLLVIIAATLLCCCVVTDGFTLVSTTMTAAAKKTRAQQQQRMVVLRASSSSSNNPEVEALLAAAAKAREEANRLSAELGKPVDSTSITTSTATLPPVTTTIKKSMEEIKSTVLPTIINETNLQQQAAAWQQLKDSKSLTKFGSATLKTYPVSLKMLQDRTGLTAETLGLTSSDIELDDFKYATLYVTGGATVLGIASLAFLPPNIGATVCYLLVLIPVLFLAIGSTAPSVIANLIASIKGTNDPNRGGISSYERRIRHEAAHFCCGYWCGLPVSQYSIEPESGGGGVTCVEFDVGTSSQYTNTEIAALAVTAMAGLVGEGMKYKTVLGATQDLIVLDTILRKSKEFIGAAYQQDITRWGALTASMLLQQNAKQYEQVVVAFQQQASIEECIAILES